MEEKKKIVFCTNLIYFLVLVALVVIRICSNYGLFAFLGGSASYVLSLITQIGILLAFPIFLFKVLLKAKISSCFRFCNYQKISAKTIVLSIALGVVVFFLNVYVSNFFNSLISLFGYKHASSGSGLPATWWTLLLSIFCTALLPAVCEETLHRGLLLNGNSMAGIKKSILISGLLFGLLHLNIEQFFYATLIGFFLGFLCCGAGSIFPCMIVHFMNNAISVCLSFARAKGWAFGNIVSMFSNFFLKNGVLGLAVLIFLLILLVLIAIELTKMIFKESFDFRLDKKKKRFAFNIIRENYLNQINLLKSDKTYHNSMQLSIEFNDSEFFEFVDKNIITLVEKQKNEEKYVFSRSAKIFLIGSFVLSSVVTIMTFIWGLL